MIKLVNFNQEQINQKTFIK